MRYADNHEPSLWLRGRLLDVDTRHRTGQTALCAHLPDRQGRPGIVVLWKPDRAACADCAPLLMPSGGSDLTCDRCGQPTDPPHLMAIREAVIVVTALCDACVFKERGW